MCLKTLRYLTQSSKMKGNRRAGATAKADGKPPLDTNAPLSLDNTQQPTATLETLETAHPPTPEPPAASPIGEDSDRLLSPEQDNQPGYSRVSPAQATEMVRLKRINPKITYQEIAAAVGVKSIATVSYWLRELDNDTVHEARKLSKSNALRATMKITEQIDHDDPRVSQGAAKAIVAMAGVTEQGSTVQVGVQVIVGSAGQPAGPDPFDVVACETQK